MGEIGSTRVRVAIGAAIALAVLATGFAFRVHRSLEPLIRSGDAAAATAELRELLVYLVVGGFAAAFALGLTVWIIATSPLAPLTRAVRSMRSDLGTRTGMRGVDEVGALGEGIDELVAHLSAEKTSLEDDRNRLAAILESMAEGVLVTGRLGSDEGVIVLANATLREMLLLDRRIIGRPPLEAIRVAGLDDILERGQASGEGAAGELEIVGIRPRRLLVRAAPLRATHRGASRGLVAVFNDVTELRRLESHRRDFVANVSHELRTPMTAIRAATETLQAGAVADPKTATEFLAIIGRHTVRLQRLVDDLLELSKIEARQWKLELQPVELRDAVSAAMETVSAAAAERGTTLQNRVSSGRLVTADRRALDQVLVNLMDNAVKYAGQKRVVAVSVSSGEAEKTVRFNVSDDGPGIDVRHLPRLFERFYRVDAGRSRAVGGTGLGLSIVKHLVEAMNGSIQVESALGTGTTFSVELPEVTQLSPSRQVEATDAD